MRACCREVFGSRSLTGRTVAIIGVGHVGGALAHRLAAEGAQLMLADIDLGKRALAAELGASWVDPPQALRAAVDVLAPCALGGVIGAEEVAELRCRVICGGANNQLSDEAVADALAARRILYAPDFIVNAAGLINVSLELTRYDRAEAMRRAVGIEAVLGRILDHATGTRQTPLAAATELARRRLEAAAQHEAPADRHAARGLPRLRRREAAGSAASRSRLG
jgi:leucine dehydrogenase